MRNLKKYRLAIATVFICLSFTSNMVLASDTDTKDMGSKTITDTNKVWTIRFKSEVDINSLSNNVQIKDITTGDIFTPSVLEGNNSNSAKISAPSGGYVQGHKYQLILNKSIKAKQGNVLPKTNVMTFSIGAKNGVSYSASANVVVSSVIPVFKQITVTSTNLPSDSKVKIEGYDKLFNIGSPMPLMLAGSTTANVYFYKNDGTTQIGTAILDISKTNNVNINITN